MTDHRIPQAAAQSVEMIYLDQKIGNGRAEILPSNFTIEGSFEWPPDAIAIVQGLFHLRLTSDKTCSVEASYPGLLHHAISAREASYFTILIGARPQFNVTTPDGDFLVFGTTGPFGDPERVTGYQLGIQAAGQHPLAFTFRIL